MRRATMALGTIALLLGSVLPAWAAASFDEAGRQAEANAEAHPVTLVVGEVPDDNEDFGETVQVRLQAPAGFTPACETSPVDWECTAGDGQLTWRQRALARGVEEVQFDFTTTVPGVNGTYTFTVTQSDQLEEGEEQPTTVTAGRPTITVTGGEDPPPEPEETQEPSPSPSSPSPSPSPSTTSPEPGDGSTEDGEPAGGQDDQDGQDSQDSQQDDATRDSEQDDEPSPRPTTRQRSDGSSLGVSPTARTSPSPQVDDPDVADDPVITDPDSSPSPPLAGEDDDGTVAATGSDPTQGSPGAAVPWQQWVGSGLLVAGALALLWQRYGDRLQSLPWRG